MSLLGTMRTCLVSTHKWPCCLNINPNAKSVKQQQGRFHPDIVGAIESKVKKLINSSFIREEQHHDQVANIIPVPNKNGKIQTYIDFHDLYASCPKDEFLFPITDVMINNTCEFERISFMDGFSGYNQIKMYPENEKYTSFKMPQGVFCCTLCPSD